MLLVTLGVLLVGGLLLFRRSGASSETQVLPDSEGEFHDLAFAITGSDTMPDGARRLHLRSADDSLVLVDAVLSDAWSEADFGLPIKTYQGAVTFLPTAGSRGLASVLNTRYATGLAISVASGPTAFTAISLEGNPARLEDGPVKIKLFFEADSEEAYAEVFFNVDLAQRSAELAEKDPEYRSSLVRAFSGN